MDISIIGGDLRIVRLTEMYAKENYNIYTYGLEKFFNKKQRNDKIIICDNIEETVKKSNIVIGGIPLLKDKMFINAPFSNKNVEINELKEKLCYKTFIAGGIPNSFYNNTINNIDLLQNEKLTILNAIPTVEGTIKIAIEEREETIFESNVLICGFGRIGKILCDRFFDLGANVFCSARKESDLTWIREKRYIPIEYNDICKYANKFDLIINTVPTKIIDKEKLDCLNRNILIIDLASNPGGIDKNYAEKIGIRVISALGIPGKEMPNTAAKYIKEIIDKIIV